MAVNQLPFEASLLSFATDGEKIYFDPSFVFSEFKKSKERMTYDYLHSIIHCVFHHMFIGSLVNIEMWDLACDIAVGASIESMEVKSVDYGKTQQMKACLDGLQKKAGMLTAEKLYRYFLDNPPTSDEIKKLTSLFKCDDHSIWYMCESEKNKALGKPDDKGKGVQDKDGEPQDQDGDSQDKGSNAKSQSGDSQDKGSDAKSQDGDFDGDAENQDDDAKSKNNFGDVKKTWEDITERIQQDLETFSKKHGDVAGRLMQNLKEVTREKYDYTEFLKKFSIMCEAMKINDDEFDYIFYTYGLNLYKNVPLIEPLEYKEIKQVKEFVIAIDTSGSVSGELVQAFITKTYNILKSQESFSSKINIHIIQCDTVIQEAVKITSQEEFDQYIKTMKLKGFGGTDFRPVFEYVDEMISNKEFTRLKGMIYFTDGYGDFPNKKPDYEVAFVFVGDDEISSVPSWAIKLLLPKEDI